MNALTGNTNNVKIPCLPSHIRSDYNCHSLTVDRTGYIEIGLDSVPISSSGPSQSIIMVERMTEIADQAERMTEISILSRLKPDLSRFNLDKSDICVILSA